MTNRNVEEHGIVRIAFITDCYWPRVNGVTVSVQTFKEELERRGHEVIVLCPEYPRRDRTLEEPGLIRFASAGSFASPEDRLVHVHEFPRIFHTLDRFRPDAVHVNTEFSLQLAARAWCKARGYPFVITAHTNWEEYVANYIPGVPRGPLKVLVRTIMRLIYGECDVLITPTAEMAAVLRGYHIRRKIRVVPTGIELSHFQATREEAAAWRARLDERHPSLAGKRLLLFVGRVTEEKNAAFLVPVLARVLRRVPDAALYYIGDGHGRAHIERLAAGAGLTDRAIVGGYLPRTELRFAYAAASIYTFPSKTETLGLSTIEAMCAGLPVVAIGEMGTRTVMRGDNGGFMVRDDQREFAEACIRLLLDPALHAAKSAEALAWSKQFSIDVQAERMERIYAFASTQRRSAMSTTQKIGLKARWMFKALERRVASIDR